jgi:hypothetical protein
LQGQGEGVFKKAFLWIVFVAALLMLLVCYFGVSGGNYSITINGEEVNTLQKMALATGGLFVAGLAAVGLLALAALVLAGTSMVLLGIFAFFFLGLLFVFSPVLVVVAGVAIVLAFVFRKRKDRNPANERCW